MKVYHSIDAFNKIQNAVVTTGTFDGVHIGHREILKRLKESALQINGESVILTFFPHPRMVLYPDERQIRLLNTIDERISLLEEIGIDHLIIHPFSVEFSKQSYSAFVENILLEKIGAKRLVVGYDHQFGHDREGGFKQLMEMSANGGFTVEEIPEQDINNVAVSSTKIREALGLGNVANAAAFLGYHYILTGQVVRGNQLGRKIGYPTANLQINEWYKLIPADGVYTAQVTYNGNRYGGMMSIGVRPTIGEHLQRTVEVNIFDFEKEIYGENITLHFVERIRNEEKFVSLEALTQRIHEDKIAALHTLSAIT